MAKVTSRQKAAVRSGAKRGLPLSERLQRLPQRAKIALFGLLFMLIGGGCYLYVTSASDGLPSGANQLVLSYEIGMSHQVSEDKFQESHGGGIAAVLYGNGLLLCSNNALHDMSAASMASDGPAWNSRKLSRDEVRALVDELKRSGFDRAAEYVPAPGDLLHPREVGRFVRINTDEGMTEAATYPGYPDTGFSAVESVMKSQCKNAAAYEPEGVILETITLPDNSAEAAQATTELPEPIAKSPEDFGRSDKEIKGKNAKALKSKMQRGQKLYKSEGKTVRARYVDMVPEWDQMTPKKEKSGGKVSAAGLYKTRWIILLAKNQDSIPGWATESNVTDDVNSIKNFYAARTGKNFDVAEVNRVRGNKTAEQYRTCPAGVNCQGSPTLAALYNLQAELRDDGSRRFLVDGYSTNVLIAFNAESGCVGWGMIGSNTAAGQLAVTNGGTGEKGCGTQALRRFVAAHELGHTFSLQHVCSKNMLMSAGGSDCPLPSWKNATLTSSQTSYLRDVSLYFNTIVAKPTTSEPIGYGMMPGTSPSIWDNTVAFQANTGSLWTKTIGGGGSDRGLGMWGGTSPAMYGGEFAFNANNGSVYRNGTYLGLGFMPGTSPDMWGGDIAFQANTGSLYVNGNNQNLGMMGGTSPSIYGNVVVFQANTGSLWMKTLGGKAQDLGLGMNASGTSPDIWGNTIVFRANTNTLWIKPIGSPAYNTGLGINPGTSPAIYGDKVVFQAYGTGSLWRYNISTGVGADLHLGMAPNTSPDIYGDRIVFQANTNKLWQYNLATNNGSQVN